MAEARQSEDNSSSLSAGSEVTFDIVCTPCDNDGDISEADTYCVDCKEYLCATCLKYHNKLAGSKNHMLVDKGNVQGTHGSLPVIDVCTQRCKIHNEEIIKYYCPTHRSLICGVCLFRSHEACKCKNYIPDEAKSIADSKEFKECQALVMTLTKKSEIVLKTSDANIQSSADFRNKAFLEIETFRREINDTLDKLKSALQEQADDMTGRFETEMSSIVDQMRNIQAELKQMSSEFGTLLSKGQHCQMFIEMKSAEAKLEDLQVRLKQAEASCNIEFVFRPNENLRKLVAKKNALGELLTKYPEETSATHVANINVKSRGNKKTCRINGATLVNKDRLVVVDFNNKASKLIDIELKQIISEYMFDYEPRDVTTVDTNQVAVTLPDAKKIVLMKSEEVLSIDREIHVNQQCWQISYIRDNLVVSFNDPPEVRIMSMTGDVLKILSSSSTGEQLFSSPLHLTVNPSTQTIYASDWKKNNVIMLGTEGKPIAEYKDDKLTKPALLSIDDTGKIFVCGNHSNNIHLLTPFCTKVKILLTECDGIQRPRSVCYCRDTRKLYVGMADNDIVKVYQL